MLAGVSCGCLSFPPFGSFHPLSLPASNRTACLTATGPLAKAEPARLPIQRWPGVSVSTVSIPSSNARARGKHRVPWRRLRVFQAIESRPVRVLQCLDRASPVTVRRTARCVLYYNTILARGPAARPRCIPPACGASPASSRVLRHRNVWPLHRHSEERSCSPEIPMTKEPSCPLET